MIHIGTSGYSFKDWKGEFYPVDIKNSEMLDFYARHFKVVEINSTYYAIPKPATFERMAEKTPPDFGFTVKAHGGMTHDRKDNKSVFDQFEEAIQPLIQAGFVVMGVGGGGIPVVEDENGDLIGVEAVIDKDFASSLLATTIRADLFLISTAIEKVALDFNQPDQRWLDRVTITEARQYLDQGHFAKGSMEPKVQAIIDYLENGGQEAIVTNPENIGRALAGETGTRFIP